jgi:SpoVK/Ycf46/Vps4 family AAA+-type ATPase
LPAFAVAKDEVNMFRIAYIHDGTPRVEPSSPSFIHTISITKEAYAALKSDSLSEDRTSIALVRGRTCRGKAYAHQIIANVVCDDHCDEKDAAAKVAYLCMDTAAQNNLNASAGAKVAITFIGDTEQIIPIHTGITIAIKPTKVSDANEADKQRKIEAYAKDHTLYLCAGNTVSFGDEDEEVIEFVVQSTTPSTFGAVTSDTAVDFRPYEPEMDDSPTGYGDIGGMDKEIEEIKQIIDLPLRHAEVFATMKMPPPRGLLLYGPPGTGKTTIARAIANEAGANFYVINGPEVIAKGAGESEANLRMAFEQAQATAPSILFLDEIDSIAPSRGKNSQESERRLVTTLLTCMDGLKGRNGVIVIGATNRPNALDPALRRFGRFDRELLIGAPSETGRRQILQKKLRIMPQEDGIDLDKIAQQTGGFVGADLAAVVSEASMIAVRRFQRDTYDVTAGKFSDSDLAKLKIRQGDLEEAVKKANPSSLRDTARVPDVKWADIAGMEKEKQLLYDMVVMPMRSPQLFEDYKTKPSKGILLCGPPGGGKTLLAKGLANMSGLNFISVKGPELLTMWFGESESNVRDLFAKARVASPCVLFFDEIDSIGTKRSGSESSSAGGAGDRVLNQLLTEMDGVGENKGLFIIAATNRADLLDPAITRPGRIDRKVYIGLPSQTARRALVKQYLGGCKFYKGVGDRDTDSVASLAYLFNGLATKEDAFNLLPEDMQDKYRDARASSALDRGKIYAMVRDID